MKDTQEGQHIPNIRNDFSKVADFYVKYRLDYPDRAYELIYSFCPSKDAKVLDVGCGTGIVTNHLATNYKDITGTDKDQAMVDLAKTGNKEVNFITSKTEKLPFEDGTFDLVTVAAAYHWFDYDLAGKEIYRVLKPDGKLCVFWKYDRNKSTGYLPPFASENLKKFVSVVPKSNKEAISAGIFKRVGFSKVEEEEFDFDDTYTKDEIQGYIQSHSTMNLLTDEQKKEYIELNAQTVDGHLENSQFIFKSGMMMYFIEK